MRRMGQRQKGQVSLEVGFAMMAAFALILGSVVLFGWLNSRLVYRQESFETGPEGRKAAGLVWSEVQVDESTMEKLDIFDW